MIRQLVPSAVCLKCRGCCRFSESDSVWTPSLLEEEFDRLIASGIPPSCVNVGKKLRTAPDTAPDSSGHVCTFLSAKDNRCRIYAQRPLECRLYPFLLSGKGARVMLVYDLNCPYVHEHHATQRFKEYGERLFEQLKRMRIQALLADNPHILQEYPEAVVFAQIH